MAYYLLESFGGEGNDKTTKSKQTREREKVGEKGQEREFTKKQGQEEKKSGDWHLIGRGGTTKNGETTGDPQRTRRKGKSIKHVPGPRGGKLGCFPHGS